MATTYQKCAIELEQRSGDPDVRRWLGQVTALTGLDTGSADAAILAATMAGFHSIYEREHNPAKNQIWDIIYRQLAKAELKAPLAQQGGFILARSNSMRTQQLQAYLKWQKASY
jgi:hypothetical protein